MMHYKSKKISIIIPIYGGGFVIEKLVGALKNEESLERSDLEIILVNDGSPFNGTHEICENLTESDPTLKYISLSRNFSEHNAVMAGLNYCTGDYAVIMDDDFQNPPEEVNKLVVKLEEGYDAVFSSYEKKQHHMFRNLGSKFNNYVAGLLLDKPASLYLSSFKAVNRFTIDEIIKYKGAYPYVDGLILRSTSNYHTVRVRHDRRLDGKSSYTIRKLISLWLNMATNFSIIPLRISMVIGLLFSIISLILAGFFAIEKIRNPSLPIGWASIMVSMFMLGSIQLFAIGMLGEYLGRLFLNTGGRPQYVVRSTINCEK